MSNDQCSIIIRLFTVHCFLNGVQQCKQTFQINQGPAGKEPAAQAEKLENGRANPTLYSLLEIAKALDVSLPVLGDV